MSGQPSSPPRRSFSLSRRSILAGVGIAAALPLAGCTEEEDVGYEETPTPVEEQTPSEDVSPDLPVREHSEEYEATLEEGLAADVTDLDSFRAALEDHGLAIEKLEPKDRFLFLEYFGDDPARGVLRDMGFVAGAYATLVSAIGDPGRLEVSVLEDDGTPFGSYTAYVAWARDLDEGELTPPDYGEKVFETFKTKRG